MSNAYSEKQLDHYLAIMDCVAELWWQKFPERAAYSPGYWHLFMGLYKNRKQAITKGEAAEFLNAAQIKSPATRAKVIAGAIKLGYVSEQKSKSPAPVGNELRAEIARYVESLRQRYTPRLDARSPPAFVADWKDCDVMGSPLGPMGVLAWYDPKGLTERLLAEAQAQFGLNGNGAFTAAKKAELLGQLVLGQLERDEEALVQALQARGVDAVRRRDASPEAVLGVQVASAAKAA